MNIHCIVGRTPVGRAPFARPVTQEGRPVSDASKRGPASTPNRVQVAEALQQ
jgi:hypothetical protein